MTPRPSPAGSWALRSSGVMVALAVAVVMTPVVARATPANRAALEKHYDRFLAKGLDKCRTCHLPSENRAPENLQEFPHNPFGDRLRVVGERLAQQGLKSDLSSRLGIVAKEDADGDGVDNETEILLGHNPGDAKDTPTQAELRQAAALHREFASSLRSYRWQPFETVRRPPVPTVHDHRWVRNPIDAFLEAEREGRHLTPRPEAPREILLRRLFLDLIGLTPTPAEQRAFLEDTSADAYERVVDQLLNDPRYGERWGRHWMDVWRYSDWAGWTDGGQIRDSQPHIWRWRDWIVESLNADKPYDRMVMEMLAADELEPDDPDGLRATGFLVRNYKMLSREQWLEDTIKHTWQAFQGLTLGCAKCHNHMTDPVSQNEYYQVRAIFEPHQVRADRVPGQTNTALDGLARVFDVGTNPPTWLFQRGDERFPRTNRVITPGVPVALGGAFRVQPVSLPRFASEPDKRDYVIRDTIRASEKALAEAREAREKLRTNSNLAPGTIEESDLNVALARARHEALLASVQAERIEDEGRKDSPEWKVAATEASHAQHRLAVCEARLKAYTLKVAAGVARSKADEAAKAAHLAAATNSAEVAQAKQDVAAKADKDLEAATKKMTEAEKALADAEKELQSAPGSAYKPRPTKAYPATSTGRRLAFARWVTDGNNPLTARVAMNHVWLRHFGRGLVPTPADFGRNGGAPSHPQLLDWLASEFMARHWSLKAMHRLMVTSSAYRAASTPDVADLRLDPDNVYLWRMNARRLEAEAVRDNLLYVSGSLDPTMGGPEIDHKLGLTSRRRSLYLRIAAEKEVEFLKIFDGPSVTECYERRPSVVPQQALALANSELALAQSRVLARALAIETAADSAAFVTAAFRRVLARNPSREELRLCREFLSGHADLLETGSVSKAKPLASSVSAEPSAQDAGPRARENLVLVLLNHNDFVTAR